METEHFNCLGKCTDYSRCPVYAINGEVSPKEFINRAADACLEEQMATIQHEALREHWRKLIRKYLYAAYEEGKKPLDPYEVKDAMDRK